MTLTEQLAIVAAVLFATLAAWLLAERKRLTAERADGDALAELANDAVLVADFVSGGILFANEASEKLLGFSRQELKDRKISELHPEALIDKSAERIAEVWEKKGLVYSDLPFVNAAGETVDVEISANLGRFRGKQAVLIYGRDIRQRLQAERQIKKYGQELETTNRELREAQGKLVQSEKLASLGNLAAGLAHEINNPIGALTANVDVSRRATAQAREIVNAAESTGEAADIGKLRRAIMVFDKLNDTSEQAAKRIADVVVTLRNFARLDEEEKKRVDIHEGIDSTLELLRHKFSGKIEVRTEYAELPTILCRPRLLNQVYMHVLVNSIEATEDRGVISVNTERETEDGKDWAVLMFSDTGKGIAPDKMQGIFDPGYTTRGVGVGAGLGLSTAYRIMQEHDGEIIVASDLGRGTTVTLKLPIN